MIFESLRAHSFQSPSWGFLVQSPLGEDGIRISARSLVSIPLMGIFGSEPSRGGWYSNLCALTRFNPPHGDFWFRALAGRMIFESLRAHFSQSPRGDFWFRALAGRMIFESLRAHSFQSPSWGFLVQSPRREDGVRIPMIHSNLSHCILAMRHKLQLEDTSIGSPDSLRNAFAIFLVLNITWLQFINRLRNSELVPKSSQYFRFPSPNKNVCNLYAFFVSQSYGSG
jgi:hypothetical protein